MDRVDSTVVAPAPEIRGPIYWVRIIFFDSSAVTPTIQFDGGRKFNVQALTGYIAPQLPMPQIVGNQIPNQSPGNPLGNELSTPIARLPYGPGGAVIPWQRIMLTGSVSIEYSSNPFEAYPGFIFPLAVPTVDGLGATQQNQQTIGLFNGINVFDRWRESNANNLSNQSSNGAAEVTPPGFWSATNSPAVNTQATASRAAAGGTTRHVATSVTASFAAGATAGAAVQVNLRDGATGVGTILWSAILTAPIGDSRSVTLGSLNLIGSANTAMTLEFVAAGGATTLESVTLTGYDAS